MSRSMRHEHDKILDNWVKNGHWTNIGVIRHIFALKKNESCFSLVIYLKVLLAKEGIHIIASCFEENSKDFMIVNPEGMIDGAGDNFLSILGPKVAGLPLDIVSDVGE